MRAAAAIVLITVGCAAAFVAWGPLQNLFEYRDSPVSTYLALGLPWLVFALAAFAGAWRLISPWRLSEGTQSSKTDPPDSDRR